MDIASNDDDTRPGGVNIEGEVNTGGGDIVGRDKIIIYHTGISLAEHTSALEAKEAPSSSRTFGGRISKSSALGS